VTASRISLPSSRIITSCEISSGYILSGVCVSDPSGYLWNIVCAPEHGKPAADLVRELLVDLVVEHFYSMAKLVVPSMAAECAAVLIVYVLILSSSYFFYRRYRPKQNPNAPIWRLPTELVLYIAKMLPPASAAAFALTSRPILNTVGRGFLNLKRKDRLKLLTLLQPDMPNHVLCYQCAVFHCKCSSYQQCHREAALPATDGAYWLPFSWALQLMNRHYYGQNHKVPADIIHFNRLKKYPGFSRQTTFDFRISTGDLIIRQEVAVVYNRNDKLVKKKEKPFDILISSALTCGGTACSTQGVCQIKGESL
jgi:hypothetical protein